jgi:DNA-binding response OmpR family regulator
MSGLLRQSTFLVAEDDADLRRLITTRLIKLGVVVHEVGDGAAAIEFLKEHTPTAICLDLAMPVTSGFEVLRFARATSRLVSVPILVVTGRDTLESHAVAKEHNVCAFFSKPFKTKLFLAKVEEILSQSTTSTEIAPPGNVAAGEK